MINSFNEVVGGQKLNSNTKYLYILDHHYKVLTGGSSNAKDPQEPKYQYLMKKENTLVKKYANNSSVFLTFMMHTKTQKNKTI